MALRKDLSVLVVDDMTVSRQILLQLLEHMGVQNVRSAAGGVDAMLSLERWPADIVVCDMNMPDMTGLQLLQHLRGDATHQRVGFVMTSGEDDSDMIQEAWHEGMDQFLPKPFEMDSLITCLEGVAGRM
ncbi:MAG: response regulator [Marinosulfonomonas sp.]|nr:response regulator [Marinosulfonomonas sp.]